MKQTIDTPEAVQAPTPQPEYIGEARMTALLMTAVRDAGGQSAFARKAGVTPQHVSDVLNARRAASEAVLAVLRLKRVTRYKVG